jgi:hypothetical protein
MHRLKNATGARQQIGLSLLQVFNDDSARFLF